MSVVIKGMQMPEDCFSCPLKEEGFCNITNAYAGSINEKNSDCPLMELPEHHGRLIDADVVYNKMECGIRAGNFEEGYEKYSNINNMDDCLDCVKYADTVIGAEG